MLFLCDFYVKCQSKGCHSFSLLKFKCFSRILSGFLRIYRNLSLGGPFSKKLFSLAECKCNMSDLKLSQWVFRNFVNFLELLNQLKPIMS